MAVVTVPVELPEDALTAGGTDVASAAEEMRRLFVLEQLRMGRVGTGRAAQMAGMSLAGFFRYMAEHKVSPFALDDQELGRELEPLP